MPKESIENSNILDDLLSQITPEEQEATDEKMLIMQTYPSICWHCKNSRKTAKSNMQNGYVGCNLRMQEKDWTEISEAKEVAEGWVYLACSPFSNSSGTVTDGLMTNFQLITKEVKKCKSYDGE